ncbi:MAG TPA: hypothetical protein VKP60_03500 [Magnetospirillaceae bacterium]|nr:hypothetical protein [Magnetospirillaceae bacterium]
MTATSTEQANAEKLRQELRRFVDALAERLGELDKLAHLALRFTVFSTDEYAEFKQLFLNFRDLCDEFQMLSRLAEVSLAAMNHEDQDAHDEAAELEENYRKLQVPMLRAMIKTNLRLLLVWDDRLRGGDGLPYGSRELFHETVRIIDTARNELLRPRYMEMLEEDALEDAAKADKLLRTLIARAPQLFDFLESQTIDAELMKLINGLPN